MTDGDCRYVHWLSGSPDGIVKVRLVGRSRKQPKLWDVRVVGSSIPGAPPTLQGVCECALYASYSDAHQSLVGFLKYLLRGFQPRHA
jgi:hypothetical protein